MGALVGLASHAPALGSQDDLPEAGRIVRNLEGILSSPEYDTGDAAGGTRSFFEWLGHKLGELMESLAGLGQTAPVLFWMILVACVVVLALIFVHAGVVLYRALHAARSPAPAIAGGRGDLRDDPRELLEQARGEAAASRFGAVVRLCHRAALLGLDHRGLIRFDESLTTGDCVRQLRKHPVECSRFESLARLYEPACFGRVPVEGQEASQCLALAERLLGEGAA